MQNVQCETIYKARVCVCMTIVAMSFFIHSIAFGGWTYIAREDKVNYYLKPESIMHIGAYVRGWVKRGYPVDDRDGIKEVERYIEVDCVSNKYRLIRYVTYYRNGEIKRHESRMHYDWKYGFSSMSNRAIIKSICSNILGHGPKTKEAAY